MFRRLHFQPNLFNDPFRPDEECDPVRADKFEAHEAFLSVSAIGVDDALVFIDEQRERQMVFLSEVSMSLDWIRADAENDSAFPFEFGIFIPESAGLFGAAGSGIFWIEVQDYVFAAKTGQRDNPAVMAGGGKIGSDIALL